MRTFRENLPRKRKGEKTCLFRLENLVFKIVRVHSVVFPERISEGTSHKHVVKVWVGHEKI